MDGFKDWTYNSTSFRGLPDIVSDLHAKGQHYVIIVVSFLPVRVWFVIRVFL